MKIALINKFYPPVIGGIEYHVRLLAENLAMSNEVKKIEIIVANDRNTWSKEKISDKIFITRIPNIKTIASTPIAPKFIEVFKKLDVDLFHFHFPYPFGDFAWLLSGVDKPYIITYHSDIIRQKWLNKLYSPIRNQFFRKANKIIATSPRLVESSAVLQEFKEKVTSVPLGINPAPFLEKRNLENGQKLRCKYNNKPIVLFVGRFVYYKGVEVLINAFKSIDANLIMVGKGPLKEKLKSMVKEFSIEDKVFFYDAVSDDDLIAYFHASDIFVLPSIASTEAYGLVQLEAQACGKPVISTNLPTGVPYVNKHNLSGVIVEPGNVHELCKAMQLLVEDESLRIKLGVQARRRMLSEFTDKIMSDKIMWVYNQVLK